MSKFEVEPLLDYVKQFKENFIGGLLGEDDIDDTTLEDICSSIEKEDSASKCSTSRRLKAESRNAGSQVRKNLFGATNQREVSHNYKYLPSTPKKTANSRNIQQSADNDEEILLSQGLNGDNFRLSQAIKSSPGKFFGSGGSPESLNGRETPKRKRTPQKLSKFSPFSKKARALRESGFTSIKNYFSVIKSTSANSALTNEEHSSSSGKLKNFSENTKIEKESSFLKLSNGECSNGLPERIDSEILFLNSTDTKVIPSTLVKSVHNSSPIKRNESYLLPSNSIVNETVFRTPEKSENNVSPSASKKSTPKSPKKVFVDTYNCLLLRIVSEMYINTLTPNGQGIYLLSSEEDDYMQAFNTLPSKPSAQRIYGRLLSRKYDWIRVSTMKYSKVTNNLIEDLGVLENYGLVTSDNTNEPVDVLCNYLTLPELKSICQFLNITQLKSGNKADIIEQIKIRYKQKTITSFYKQETGTNNLVKERVLSTLGKCVKLTEGPRKTMFRCLLFFSYPHFKGLEKERFQHQLDLIRAWSNDVAIYPKYNVFRTNIFPSREHFLEYEAALELKSDLIELIEQKDWDEALHRTLLAIEKYKDFAQNSEKMCWVKKLPDFLRRFTAGAVYVSSINKGIDVLRKYNENIDRAEHCLRMLIDQDVFSVHRRGQWFERLALVCQRNCKSNEKAATVVFEGLKSKKNLDIVSRHVLSARATLLIGRKTNKIKDISKDSLRLIVEPDLSEPFSVQISEQVLPGSKAGRKKIFVQDSEGEKTLTSVEDVARAHFRKQGYTQGRHDEGATIKALVLACFWDIIYGEVNVEGGHSLFHSVFQNAPLDWNTETFYKRRKEAIENRLEVLLCGGVDLLWTNIEKCYNENGMMESVVPWNCLHDSLHIVKGLVECLDIKSFVAIARLLLTNYAIYHSGFPDLTLWNPLKKKCLFVEVKSSNDTLSTKQKLWLHNLTQFSVNSLVCHVNSVGCKSKNKTDSSTSTL